MASLIILSWNMAQRVSNWHTVLDSNADAALLQEAKTPPDDLKTKVILDREDDWYEPGLFWRAAVAGMVKSDQFEFEPIRTQPLGGSDPEAPMVSRPGSLAAAVVKLKETGEEITIVSIYSTWMSPVRQTGSKWIFADASSHRLGYGKSFKQYRRMGPE